MNKQDNIRLVKHQYIDREKWSRCTAEAPNSRVYATLWYLDRTAEYWNALVWGDYSYVMPLPVRKKFGINYCYQPLFCQQLGIFPSPPDEVAQAFYQALETQVRYSDVQLNASNSACENTSSRIFIPRKNYLLRLNEDYEGLQKNYSTNTRRNISRSVKCGLQRVYGIRLEAFMQFSKAHGLPVLQKEDNARLQRLVAFAQYQGRGEIQGVYDSHNQLCAAAFFLRWQNRVIYLFAVSNDVGIQSRAMFFLIDHFIRDNAGSGLTLDFEGSMLPGVARFYKGFGAEPETYFQLKINRLPHVVRWIKKRAEQK